MPNMSLKKNEMPVQDPQVRNKNFKEVALGYTKEQAKRSTFSNSGKPAMICRYCGFACFVMALAVAAS